MIQVININPFERRANYYLNGVKDVSILIKTLEREKQLTNLLSSIRKYKFTGPVIIADDSRIPYKQNILQLFPELDITYLVLPYDSGLSKGRNIMLEHTQTTYFLLCDDDFIFEPRTRVPVMLSLLNQYNLDLLGGVFFQYNMKSRIGKTMFTLSKELIKAGILLPSFIRFEYYGSFEIDSDRILLYRSPYTDPVTTCDITHNFFLAKTESIKRFGGWNPILKNGEHENFFIRAKLNNLKIGTTRKCGVIHDRWSLDTDEYISMRKRAIDFQKVALQEFGFARIENYQSVTGNRFAGKT